MNSSSSGPVFISSPGLWPELLEVARAYRSVEELGSFVTTLVPDQDLMLRLASLLPGSLGRVVRREADRRRVADMSDWVVGCASPLDLLHAASYRLTGKSFLTRAVLRLRDQAFDRGAASILGSDARLVVGHAGAMLETLRVARRSGAATAVNWNIQHWLFARREYDVEVSRNRAWARTFSFSRFSRSEVVRWNAELQQTDYVLTPSESVKTSLVAGGVRRGNIVVVPYGVDGDRYRPRHPWPDRASGPLRVVFVGELGQRKGLSYLFEVARQLPRMEFRVVGWRVGKLPETAPANVFISENVPDVVPYFWQSDVFLFPSLVDGFGLVVLQALGCGLPAICSSHAGAHELIREGTDGFVVSPRDTGRMVDVLLTLQADKSLLTSLKINARARATQYPWERFHQAVRDALTERQTVQPARASGGAVR